MAVERRAPAQDVARQLFGREITSDRKNDPFFDVSLEHLFGEIWSRSGLAIRDRSLVTIAALMVLGREKQFALHLHGALNVGITPTEIEEMIVHLAYYGGYPIAASARDIALGILPGSETAKGG